MIVFKCDSCRAKFKVPDDKGGKKAKCPRCGAVLVIPMPIEAPVESGIYDLAEDDLPASSTMTAAAVPPAAPSRTAGRYAKAAPARAVSRPVEAAPAPAPSGPPVRCPSCTQQLPGGSKICVQCGVKLPNGRPVLTARSMEPEDLDDKAENVLRPVSWLIFTGIFPIYSEADGRHKPYATWTIAAITILASLMFLAVEWRKPEAMRSAKNLMLWCGSAPPTADHLRQFYAGTSYGDTRAFLTKLRELEKKDEEERAKKERRTAAGGAGAAARRQPQPSSEEEEEDELESEDISGFFGKLFVALEIDVAADKNVIAAHQSLSTEQQCFGQYSVTQLLTNAFLHGGLLHLAGNMLFLFVLGSRVNTAIGNINTAVLYPLLAVIASLAHKASAAAGMPTPALGASGAVMGLAGMYLVLFPVQKVHMVIWFRWGLLLRFRLSKKVFAVPGIFVVLFYISFDVLSVILRQESDVAHWAHLGGLITGMLVALLLLMTRLAHTGGDILSVTLGKSAWGLIGTPASHARRRAG